MIHLPNGHKLDFLVSSGALGLTGHGYFWEWPFRWFGLLKPEEFTITTKTLTYSPNDGNIHWLAPWKTFQPLPGNNFVNALGLPNPGYRDWVKDYYPQTKDFKIIVSIAPEIPFHALGMTHALNKLDIVAVELNVSCPNSRTLHPDIIDTIIQSSRHPVILKVGYNQLDLCKKYDGHVAAFDMINSVPWNCVFKDKPSPLQKYGHEGAVSGPIIQSFAREMLAKAKAFCKTDIISGGAIDSTDEVFARFVMGAKAVSFGTLFLQKPWEPNRIAKECRERMLGKYPELTGKVLSEIEGYRYSALVNIASGYKVFLNAVESQPEVQRVRDNLFLLSDELAKRVNSFLTYKTDARYEHPKDAALATYLHLLQNKELAKKVLDHRTAKLWWSKKVAEDIKVK